MAVTLKDVAAHAAVSIKTVSNVVNDRPFIAPETRERVQQAIEALGYRPNLVARSLRRSHVGVVALAVPNLANIYFGEIGQEIIAAAAKRSYTVLLDETGGRREHESLVAHGLRPHLIDGVILSADALNLEDLTSDHFPVPLVLLGERIYGAPWDHVVVDNVAASREAVGHLVQLGRRRIAFANMAKDEPHDPTISSPAKFRQAGYITALADAGMPVDPGLLRSADPTRAGGRAATHALLALPDPPDAVFCYNDLMALGAIRALYEAGLRVPDDVAVVGFDDIEDSAFATPSLTTVAPDKRWMAECAVTLLLDRIKGRRTVPPERIEAPFKLMARESTLGRAACNQQTPRGEGGW